MVFSTKKKNSILQFATKKVAIEVGKAALKAAALVAVKVIAKQAITKALSKPTPIKGITKETEN